jgi:hypothetical protein
LDNEFKLLDIVVDVAFKLLIFNLGFVEILFELLNIVVDVAFKLLIFDIEFAEMLFCSHFAYLHILVHIH